jgi:hypothetical protein
MLAACALIGFGAGLLLGRSTGAGIATDDVVAGREHVVIADGPIEFLARLDTGALVSSVHARGIEIIDADPNDPRRNRGKTVRFTLDNGRGGSTTLERSIELVQRIRSADCVEWRYHVQLAITFRGRTQKVLVNLNDRSGLAEPLLLGRNWLRQGYAVVIARRGARAA